mmetsp:Transcript_43159/g.68208  ORF Transcript_43159/g.68208 Transcript_43159/m.68208 type:complete len:1058 (-) Transcript_43159:113-3286(-)
MAYVVPSLHRTASLPPRTFINGSSYHGTSCNGSLQLPNGSALPAVASGSLPRGGGSVGLRSLARTASASFLTGAPPSVSPVCNSPSLSPAPLRGFHRADRSVSPHPVDNRHVAWEPAVPTSQFMGAPQRGVERSVSPGVRDLSRLRSAEALGHATLGRSSSPSHAFGRSHRSQSPQWGVATASTTAPLQLGSVGISPLIERSVSPGPRRPGWNAQAALSRVDRSVSPRQVPHTQVNHQAPLSLLAARATQSVSPGRDNIAMRSSPRRQMPFAHVPTAPAAKWRGHAPLWESQASGALSHGGSARMVSGLSSPSRPRRTGVGLQSGTSIPAVSAEQVQGTRRKYVPASSDSTRSSLTPQGSQAVPASSTSTKTADMSPIISPTPPIAPSPNLPTTAAVATSPSVPTKAVVEPSPSLPPATPSVISVDEELQQGVWVRIGECTCQISHAIGMGSFGAVWAAERADGSELAIKEIVCHSHSDLMNALFESHLLRVLGTYQAPISGSNRTVATQGIDGDKRDSEDHCGDAASSSPQAACARMVPTLVASDSHCIGVDTWRVRLLMTRIRGDPLDLFLEQRRKQCEEAVNAGAGTSLLRKQFEEACYFAGELLWQMAPGFEHISSEALHRDVNSHNIIIEAETSPPRYGLVDFGLAVDATCWCNEEGYQPSVSRPSRVGQDGSSTWHYLDVGGDCRYWPLSAWVQFLAGWRELATCPPLSFEYQVRLDLHALGITALQVFAEMLPLPPEISLRSNGSDILEGFLDVGSTVWDDAPPELLVLRVVWERYWNRVSPLHARLINTFHSGGDWDSLKVDCINAGVHDKIAEDLRMLRAAIRELGEACQRSKAAPPEATSESPMFSTPGAHGLFSALLMLVGDGHSVEAVQGPVTWRAVRDVLSGNWNSSKQNLDRNRSGTLDSVHRDSNRQDSSRRGRLDTGSRKSAAQCREESERESLQHSRSVDTLPILLPRPRRVNSDDARDTSPSLASDRNGSSRRPKEDVFHSALLDAPQPPHENLSRRLSDLKEKVAWLSQEMAKLGEKSEVAGRRSSRAGREIGNSGEF